MLNLKGSWQSQCTIKSRSILNIAGKTDLYSSRCMHDQNLMALAFLVSEKQVKCKKLVHQKSRS